MKNKLRMTPTAVAALGRGDLDNFIAAATPGGIEAQEAAGQQRMIHNELLPIDGTIFYQKKFEALGFKFADKPESGQDSIFIRATFPAGWKKVPTEHSMWSHLIDDKGRIRARIFFKAAFYDYNARLSVERRYNCGTDYSGPYKANRTAPFKVHVTDGGKTIHISGEFKPKDHDEQSRLEMKAREWLTEHFPEWQDPFAYWD